MLQNNSPSPQRRDPNGLKVHFLSKWKIILLEFSLLNNMKDECYLLLRKVCHIHVFLIIVLYLNLLPYPVFTLMGFLLVEVRIEKFLHSVRKQT